MVAGAAAEGKGFIWPHLNLSGLILLCFFGQHLGKRMNANRNKSWFFFLSFPLSEPQHDSSSNFPPHLSGSGVFIQSLQELRESWTTSNHRLIWHMLFWCVLTASPLTCSDRDTHLLWQFLAVLLLCRQENTGLNKDCITKTFGPVKLLLATVSWPGDLLSPGAAPRWWLEWGGGWDWVAGCPCLLWN